MKCYRSLESTCCGQFGEQSTKLPSRLFPFDSRGLTVIVNHELDIAHDLGISAVSLVHHAISVHFLLSKDACGLGIEYERDGEETLDPF